MISAATIVSASHWVGSTLPGMIDEPGSFAGRMSSPIPLRGPEPRKRMSFAIFIAATAPTLSAPDAATSASCAARSEEHTSELQSLMRISYAVFCLKKKKTINISRHTSHYQHEHHQTHTQL